MAAPVVAQMCSFGFRDAKGNVTRTRVLIGGATIAAVQANVGTLRGHLAAISNAHVYNITYATGNDFTYGTAATYLDVEDKMVLTFYDVNTKLHRFQFGAPISAKFLADQETVNGSDTDVAAVITDFQTFCYGSTADTSPLTVIGGVRRRNRMHRRFTLLTKNPSLTGPGE